MSNLWFFRLKRAEQERRRSSGEQSLGSASVHSVTGGCVSSAGQRSPAARSLAYESAALGPHLVVASGEGELPTGGSVSYSCEALQTSQRHQQQLPTVTIQRTESSCSLQVAQAGEHQHQHQQHQLLARLNQDAASDARQHRVESRLVRGHALDQQQELAAAADSLKRGLLDQLISGQVPPIQEHRLLQPGAHDRQAQLGQLTLSIDNLASLIPRVRVEFYNSENTLKEQLQMYFIKDHTVSLYLRSAKLILKVLACYLYVCRVILDRGPAYANCYGCQPRSSSGPSNGSLATNAATNELAGAGGGGGAGAGGVGGPYAATLSPQPQSKFDSHPYEGPINFRALFWVDRGPLIWGAQTTIAVICFLEAILMQYLTYKNSIFSIISFHFVLELVTNTPFMLSIVWRELRTLFVPGFLNCWLAKQCLEAMLNDLSIVRQSSVFSHRLTILSATVFCLIFTSACGFQHTQRSGGRNYITIFESIYFVVVTFSTVGYGDFKPETWPSQLFIMVMICVALIVLPSQFEQLAYFWIERKKLGASYAHHSTRHEKHVVVCSTTLRADTIMDFLNEFYAHPLLQTFSVVLLSPCELDTTMKLVLQTPTWNNRVVYIQGSALKASDLIRARMQSAEACFILAARNYNDRSAADEHTILRSWAIRDFSPYVSQYVQIFRTENKIHVAFAEHVVCDDEFKYALLANNCLIPGTSTLVTLLLHTSQQQDRRRRGAASSSSSSSFTSRRAPTTRGLWGNLFRCRKQQQQREEPQPEAGAPPPPGDCGSAPGSKQHEAEWKRLYGLCSANEIYHIRLSDSRFFGEYHGKSFTYASFHSHRKFGVALIGVQTDMRGTWPIMLNPGPSYVLKSSDVLFYINITKEENSTLKPMLHEDKRQQHFPSLTRDHGCSPQPATCATLAGPLPPEVGPTTSESEPGDAAVELTHIRVEASSPVLHQAAPEVEARAADLLEPSPSPAPPPPLLLPHSVAVGAGLVARSLCSMAGVVEAAAPLVALERSLKQVEQQRDSVDETHLTGRHRTGELRHLAASLLSKRNSSASASAAIVGGPSISGANASTLELATLATGLRKGSNISISSSKSRDVSPARLKQVVSGLAVKMKRVKLGKSLTHLTIPRMDYGGNSSSSTESFVNARGRRPSIAPVPAMMGESEEHDSDHEREQESYFSTSWHSSSESSAIVKKFVFCTTYIGVSPTLCYLLQKKKAACCLQLVNACEHCPYKNARQYNWPNRCVILASDFASNGIYNFLVPLRAHFHNPSELRPIVLLLERKPSPQFIDAISWFPMVYWMPGSIDNLDDLIKAGINMAHSVVVTNKESTNSAEEDYLADCNTIVAVQTMFKMFPSVSIITELSQSSNMRFMQFRAHDLLFGGLTMSNYYYQPAVAIAGAAAGDNKQVGGGGSEACGPSGELPEPPEANSVQSSALKDRINLQRLHSQECSKRMGKDVNSHAYKYRLPFAAGNVFSASMLDTLLYQAFVKDYMITMLRLLLGIDQAPGSGFLSSMRIGKEELWIRTYGRLYQRLCSTTCEIPLGIYRTEPLEANHNHAAFSSSSRFSAFASQQASYEAATEELERAEITNMVKNRLHNLGMLVTDYDDSTAGRKNTFSYVIINPNCDIQLREGDIIYLIRPSPIHSRKLFMHRANSVRHTDHNNSNQHSPIVSKSTLNEPIKREPGAEEEEAGSESKRAYAASPGVSQQQQQLAGYMKSCLSDGDFQEILIKVDDQQEPEVALNQEQAGLSKQAPTPPSSLSADAQDRARRRSSCSDVE